MEYPLFIRFGIAQTLGIPFKEVGIPLEYPMITPRRGSEYPELTLLLDMPKMFEI